jgi:hypothetical protein
METPASAGDFLTEEALRQCREKLAAVERAYIDAEHRLQDYAKDQKKWANKQNTQQQEITRLQDDYENLRVQKGGFGFKMLALWGGVSWLFGLLMCVLFFHFTDNRAKDFERFKREQLFSVEYALSKGHFEEVEKKLHTQMDAPENAHIQAEIEAMRKLVTAARQHCKE